MIVVSDTSALCNLQLVNCLWLLKEIYGILIIPDVVSDELKSANNSDIQRICHLEWVQIQSVTNIDIPEKLQNQHGLDAGEAHAIALAIELKADELLIDERLGRKEAMKLGHHIIGILGILVIAKQRNLIPQVKPIMNKLIEIAGFRVSAILYEKVLTLSNEL